MKLKPTISVVFGLEQRTIQMEPPLNGIEGARVYSPLTDSWCSVPTVV